MRTCELWPQLRMLRIYKFKIRFTPVQEWTLPLHLGDLFQYVFEYAFRSTACTCFIIRRNHGRHDPQCPCASVLGIPEARPFVFDLPFTEQSHCKPGESLFVKLTLFGQGVNLLPLFIHALDRMGEIGLGEDRSRLTLLAVYAESVDATEETLIYSSSDRRMNIRQHLGDWQHFCDICSIGESLPADSCRIRLHFVTPLKIKSKEYHSFPDFQLLVESIAYRVSTLLLTCHNGIGWTPDLALMDEQFCHIKLIANRTIQFHVNYTLGKQRSRKMWSGFIGYAEYDNIDPKFMHLLRLGELTHLGDVLSYGNGKIQIEMIS